MIEVRYRDRLGNNLFQYALGRILAEEKGYALKAAPIPGFPNTRQPVPGAAYHRPRCVLQRQVIDFTGLMADITPQRLVLDGWFQRGEYYWPYRDRIKKWFAKDSLIPTPPIRPDLVVHVRRSDYLFHGWALPFSFYEQAIERLNPTGGSICILTDDPTDPFFRSFERWKPRYYHGGSLQEFWLMAEAPRLILSQSTFGWWAAFLAESQATICPAPTFGCWNRGEDSFGIDLIDRDRFVCIDWSEPYISTPADKWHARCLRRLKWRVSRAWHRLLKAGAAQTAI